MPKECPCEIALREHIPVRSLVWIIASFYHQDDAAIIDALWHFENPNLTRNVLLSHLTTAESRYSRGSLYSEHEFAHGLGKNPSRDGNFGDRWIFEVGPYDSFVRFPGANYGSPVSGACSLCIITVIDGQIIVEIDKVRIDIDPRGEFGSFLGTPFMRSRRATLRSKMYNLQYLEPADPQHALFDKVCDLAHKTIWEWIH